MTIYSMRTSNDNDIDYQYLDESNDEIIVNGNGLTTTNALLETVIIIQTLVWVNMFGVGG